MQEIWVQFLDWKDPLEKEMTIHSSILAWGIPWTEEPGGLYSPRGHKELNTTKWLHFHFGDIFHHPFKLKTTIYPTLEKSENEVTSEVTFINQPPMFYSSNTTHLNLSFSSTFSPPPAPLPFTSTSLFSVSHKLLLSQFNLFSVLTLPVLLLTGFTPSRFPVLVPGEDCSHLQHPLQTPPISSNLARSTDSPALWEKKSLLKH